MQKVVEILTERKLILKKGTIVVKEHLENDEWVKISTGNGTKGEKVFEWQYTEVNCNIENHRKYLIFRRSLSDNSQIRGYIAYGNCEIKIEEFVRTAGM